MIVPTLAVLNTGDQVPVILLVDVVGNAAGDVAFLHNGPTCAKAGTICATMVTSIVTLVAHWPAVGVNV